jgi:hypothetical protein
MLNSLSLLTFQLGGSGKWADVSPAPYGATVLIQVLYADVLACIMVASALYLTTHVRCPLVASFPISSVMIGLVSVVWISSCFPER